MHDVPIVKDLVLVGGGHAHVHVLKSFGMRPVPGVRLTLVAKDVETPYSGMLPGFIGGRYTREDCHIDLRPLARFAGARLIHDEAVGVDLGLRRVLCRSRPSVLYDVLSIDIGSAPKQVDVPGAREWTTPVKPIAQLNERWEAVLERVRSASGPLRFLTVGGGAAGVEVTLAMRERLRALVRERGRDPESLSFALVTGGKVLATHANSVQERFERILRERAIEVMEGSRVVNVEQGVAVLEDGRRVAFDEALWVTQAGAAPWLEETGLKLDQSGFIAIDAALRSVSHPEVYSAGDVAANLEHPRPKAGVFAVRQGPLLADNLRRALAGQAAKPFVPQRVFLSLIGTGDGAAVASWGNFSAEGRWLWSLKDWIDRRWMRMYRELDAMGAQPVGGEISETVVPGSSEIIPPAGDMRCGGCGAKVGASALERVLARLNAGTDTAVPIGLAAPDDAAVLKLVDGKFLVQSVDFFRAFVDDPYEFGRIAANHALGDVFAMGGEPTSALAIATVPFGPTEKVEEDLFLMLRGGLDVLQQAGATLIGGHSAEGAELALGFTVNGIVDPNRILRKSGMQPGEALILVKPLGTGTLLAAEMRGKARHPWIAAALKTMQQSNRDATRVLLAHGATAATDVTGFGLAGHLIEMLRASGVDGEVKLGEVPVIEGALDTLSLDIASTLAPENARARHLIHARANLMHSRAWPILFDPQTAGGLLASVPMASADDCLAELQRSGYEQAAIIGQTKTRAHDAPSLEII